MFKSLLKAAVGTVLLPVDVVSDVVMLPKRAMDDKGWATTDRLSDISDNLKNATKPSSED